LRDEIRPLTGIRGAAAFTVMLYHYATFPPFADLHWSYLHKGYLCVDLFFVLSGFVLALRYGERFRHTPSWATYGAFLRARAARLYPAYLVLLALYYGKWTANIAGTNEPYALHEVLANLLFVQSWGVIPARSIIGDSWSVSVEIIAYLLLPLLLIVALEKATRAAVILALAAIGTLIFIANVGHGVNGPLDEIGVYAPLRCLADFSLGLVAFRATQIAACQKVLSKAAMPGIALILLATALIIDRTDVLIVLVLPVMVACLSYDGKINALLFGNKVIHQLGEISYSLYLLHPFFRDAAAHFERATAARLGVPVLLPFALLGVAMTWLAASFVYRFVEVPGRRFLSVSRSGVRTT
jgi:peptidoglycan/LPS O-acetylase OafA/YrhL